MTNDIDGNATRACGARALFAPGILLLILTIVFASAYAATPVARAATKGNPRLANLQIELWPEFDRPATALVFLKGEIAAGVPLPAAVTLRLRASSGGPTAVAYSAESGGNLRNLKFDRTDADSVITIKFNVPERYFHIEYYDPLAESPPGMPGRSYRFVWNGDLATDQLQVVLQEPAAVSAFSVQPPLDATAVGQDGLRYRSAELGAFQAGKSLAVQVGYTRTDPRTTIEILKPEPPDAPPLPVAGRSKMELALWLVAVFAFVGLAALAAMAWWERHQSMPRVRPGDAPLCTGCGAPMGTGDGFCSKCGAARA